MVQVQKPHVRDALLLAAAQTFAELGFEATTMADVAARAGSSIGNLYKYFASKQQLFDAAVPAELVHELSRRTGVRMRAFGTARDVRELAEGAPYHALAGELLDYCLAHRAAVVVVLARAEGTPYAAFSGQFAEQLTAWSLDYARSAYPQLEPSPAFCFVLRRAYRSFIAAVAEALQAFPTEADARAVIALLTTNHQGGLKRLFETQGGVDAQSQNPDEPSVREHTARPRARDARATRADSRSAEPRAGQADRPRRARRRR